MLDVETAFLEGKLDEDVYLEIPEGMAKFFGLPDGVSSETHVLKLNSSMYGLIQSARCFFKELTGYLVNHCNFVKSEADPCLYFKWMDEGLTLWMSWVDDMFVTGNNVMK